VRRGLAPRQEPPQRAEALIAVAAPRFPDELMGYAVESKLLS
jgi:acyl-CoA hydrolase